ncbi:AmmeMemoRadiSam system protein A [Candidatus Riflebacteria bacterium]
MEETIKKHSKFLLNLAKNAILSSLDNTTPAMPEAPEETLNSPMAAFVTLRTNGMLRGCIGHMQARDPLLKAIFEMARAAAFSDPRFPPLKKEEFQHLSIELSILTPMQEMKENPLDFIRLGIHGVHLDYQGYSSVFLPEVPIEVGWDTITYLEELSRKAGLPGDSWKKAKLHYFTSIKIKED